MGTNAVQRDATAKTVSANVKRLRTDQNLGLRGLSTKLGEVGRPLGHSAVDQIEKGTRRVDVDDLMALAVALGVSPATLLMPAVDTAGRREHVTATAVNVAPGTAAPVPVIAEHLWRWLTAEAAVDAENLIAFAGRAWPRWRQERLAAEVEAANKALQEHIAAKKGMSDGDD
jgi:transcriptional regulator with XRE-family HTH domain